MTRQRLVNRIAPYAPMPVKRLVHFVLDTPGRRNVQWLRKAVRVSHRFKDELVLCPNGDVYERDQGGPEFLVPLDLTRVLQMGTSGTEPLESRLLAANLTGDAPVMLDVGANVGLHSIRTACARPAARICAFEPVTANYQVLCKNIARNQLRSRIEAVHAAVGAEDGTVSISAGYGTGNWVGATNTRDVETVQAVSIDSFLEKRAMNRVTLIKCDAEGYELHVLRGARRCLERLRPKLLLEVSEIWCRRFEYHPSELFNFLGGLGYDYLRITAARQVLPPSGDLARDLDGGNNFCFFPKESSFATE
jgi:FkbM family methyltransferase